MSCGGMLPSSRLDPSSKPKIAQTKRSLKKEGTNPVFEYSHPGVGHLELQYG